ncbi:MAG: isoprenyl transferase [Candidatus Omnitrophica bacterium]|nr:isoprenyl transferase [Candidatus Omnitrophota bacterium]
MMTKNNKLMEGIDSNNLPKHVAIIMDGNGRWAKQRGLLRTQGHLEGVKRVEEIINASADLGIKVLTLFTFSTENWGRSKSEVSMLMNTLVSVLRDRLTKLVRNNVKFQTIGRSEGLPQSVIDTITSVREKTKNNTGLILNLAFNYGGRIEILDAVKLLAQKVQNGDLRVADISEEVFSQALYTKDLPDPDLLIRTSGEKRISNFLLWQLSYAELYFTEKFWPEFTAEELKKAVIDYQGRERRYGKILTKRTDKA